eukprot:TRINITY_DN20_c0_g1_i5.p1 TRINITY_DN20_c0_g1~~TRINITY_DN20_c0_g1_i5.p1  ORF type:complete len:1038 (+),score=334.85 TRINITY_DN20_c0_g1_i5:88-3201(+)
MGGADFTELISIGGFLAALFMGGWVFQKAGLSPILGEIAVGVVLGPEVAELMGSANVDKMKLLGTFGVTLMIFESGMHINFDTLKKVAGRSMGIAVLGTFLPIFAGIGFAAVAFPPSDAPNATGSLDGVPVNLFNGSWLYPNALHLEAQSSVDPPACNEDGSGSGCPDDEFTGGVFPDGLALGCALAPTSVGIALKLLTEAKQLGSMFGQTIITGAFVDDIFSIVALVILINLAAGEFTAATVLVPLVLSFTFLFVGGGLAYQVWPWLMEKVLSVFANDTDESMVPRHRMHLLIMFALLCFYGYLSSLLGSHLLGAFVAGMSFARVPRSHHIWVRQMKRITKWLVRIFFGATVAFSIPISTMLTLEAFYKGLLCGIGPCILTKIMSGIAAKPSQKMVVGTAMVGRGEFAYLVAETAKSTLYKSGEKPYGRMMSTEVYSVCVWALLLSTICAPFSFQYFLTLLTREKAIEKAASGRECVFGFYIKVKGNRDRGSDGEVLHALRELKLNIYNIGVETDGEVFVLTATCFTKTRRSEDDLDDVEFASIKHHVLEAMTDEDAQVMIVPTRNDKEAQLGGLALIEADGSAIESAKLQCEPEQFAGFLSGQVAHWQRGEKTPLLIRFAGPTTLGSYTLKTGSGFENNAIEPTSWKLEGLRADGEGEKGKDGWETIHETNNYNIPTERNTEYGPFNVPEEQRVTKYLAVRYSPVELKQKDEGDHAAPPGNELAFLHGQAFRPGVRLSTEDTDAFDEFIVIKLVNKANVDFLCHTYALLQDLDLEVAKAKLYHVEAVTEKEPTCMSVFYCRDLLQKSRIHHGVRMQAIRHAVEDLYEESELVGRSMVRSVKCIDVPVMYGCTPHVKGGERVGEFLFVYKHVAEIPKEQHHPLTQIYMYMEKELGLQVSAFCHDVEDSTGLDHATIFVKDMATEDRKEVDQAIVVAKFLSIFKEEGIPARVSGFIHEVGPTEPIRFDHWPVKRSTLTGSGMFGDMDMSEDDMGTSTNHGPVPIYTRGGPSSPVTYDTVQPYDQSMTRVDDAVVMAI